jgi:small subunit ribosomal protein S1
MANRALVRELAMSDREAEDRVRAVMGALSEEELRRVYEESIRDFQTDTIIRGRIVGVVGDDVLVDIGYKSEGVVPKTDFAEGDPIQRGAEIEVLLESIEGDSGMVSLSKSKADKIRGWERIITQNKEGDVLKGRVVRKIKGGLLVEVGGVPVFLPASQVDIRKVEDIGVFLGQEIECKILKIDEKRMNVIVSRRKLLEEQRDARRRRVFETLAEGDVIEGEVRNIADFGVFVDVGGVDGLLHITDLSWGRVRHPGDVVQVGDRIRVKVLRVDRENEKIALSLKHMTPNPWDRALEKYPVGCRVKGRVTNLQPYGAFVELEPGVEGLVHVSEMSWTRQVNNPSEVVSVGDEVQVVVKSIDPVREEIALSLRDAQVNPWDFVEQRYPPGSRVKGQIRNLAPYGAFVELEDGVEGLLHINDISWTKRLNHPSEVFRKGDRVDVVVLAVDKARKRISLGRKQLEPNPWESYIPEKYKENTVHRGRVNKIVSFGAFVELEKDLEGLLHASRMGDSGPGALKQGDVIDVRVVRVDPAEGKIALALESAASPASAPSPTPGPAAPSAG